MLSCRWQRAGGATRCDLHSQNISASYRRILRGHFLRIRLFCPLLCDWPFQAENWLATGKGSQVAPTACAAQSLRPRNGTTTMVVVRPLQQPRPHCPRHKLCLQGRQRCAWCPNTRRGHLGLESWRVCGILRCPKHPQLTKLNSFINIVYMHNSLFDYTQTFEDKLFATA